MNKAAGALVAALGASFGYAAEPVDLLLHGGHIVVLDEADSRASAMAVRDGKVIAIGGKDLLQSYTAEQQLHLNGRTVMPGFNDTHVHISGKPRYYIDLTKVTSVAEIKALVEAKRDELAPGSWITGYGWSEDALAEQRRPLITDLDAAAPDNPVMLTRAGAHSAVFSSKALALAGITADTPNPAGGIIEKDAHGELNGIIRERHQLVGRLVPPAPPEEIRASLIKELQALFALGITSITEAMTTIDYYPEWQRVYAENPGVLPRASVQVAYVGRERMAAFGRKTGDGDDHLKVGPIKIFVDGGFTGPAAYTKAPYKGEDTYRGHLNITEAELERVVRAAHGDGWQMGIHAIGDAAIELAVDVLANTLDQKPRTDHRHYLNHFTIMPATATMEKMAAYGIAITQQPNFMYTLEGRYTTYLDGKRLEHNNPMATPMKHGIHVAISSDILPLGPWVGVYAATTRKGSSGRVFGAAEKISRFEALRAYTHLGAWLTREEARKGTLEPGMLADFIVLSANPMAVADNALLGMQTEATYLGGQQVWSRE